MDIKQVLSFSQDLFFCAYRLMGSLSSGINSIGMPAAGASQSGSGEMLRRRSGCFMSKRGYLSQFRRTGA